MLICCVVWHIRIEKEPKGHEECGNSGYLSQFIWQWHIETILRGMCLSTFLVARPLPSTFIVLLLDKEPALENLPRRWCSSSAKERWGVAEVHWRLFLNVNRGIHDHPVASVSVCLAAFFSFSPQKNIYRHARSHINSSPFPYPVIPIHAAFRLFNHCGGLWEAELIEGGKRNTRWTVREMISAGQWSRRRSQPQQSQPEPTLRWC